jgi:hypothetical protein
MTWLISHLTSLQFTTINPHLTEIQGKRAFKLIVKANGIQFDVYLFLSAPLTWHRHSAYSEKLFNSGNASFAHFRAGFKLPLGES